MPKSFELVRMSFLQAVPFEAASFLRIGLILIESLVVCLLIPPAACGAQFAVPLFDGRTFKGWEGDTNGTWRIEAGAITAGSPDPATPRNAFPTTMKSAAIRPTSARRSMAISTMKAGATGCWPHPPSAPWSGP